MQEEDLSGKVWSTHSARSADTLMKAKKLSRVVAILVRSVTSQSCYRSCRYPYTLVCLSCPSRARHHHQEAKNAVAVRKSRQNF